MKRIGMLGALLLAMFMVIVGGSVPAQATTGGSGNEVNTRTIYHFCHANKDGTYTKAHALDIQHWKHGETLTRWDCPPNPTTPPVVVAPEPEAPVVPVVPETPVEPTEPPVTVPETPAPPVTTPEPEPEKTEPPAPEVTTPPTAEEPKPTEPPVLEEPTEEPSTEPTEPPVDTKPVPDYQEAVPCPGEVIDGKCTPSTPTTPETDTAEACEAAGFKWVPEGWCFTHKANNPPALVEPAPVVKENTESVIPAVAATTPAATPEKVETPKPVAATEAAPEGQLAETGVSGIGILWAGILLIAGAVLLLGARRYKNS